MDGGQRIILVTSSGMLFTSFEKGSISDQLGKIIWPVRTRDPLVPTSVALGLQVCATMCFYMSAEDQTEGHMLIGKGFFVCLFFSN